MEKIKELLRKEVGLDPNGKEVDKFLALAEEIPFAPGEPVIESGKVDRNVYVVKEGIIRYVDQGGDKERTFAFGPPGTMFMSMFSFWKGDPAHHRIEACCDSVILKVKYEDFWELVNNNFDVAKWMLDVAYGQLWSIVYMNSNIRTGTAVQRVLSMWNERPEIIRNVPQKIIASYLGITPEYLSQIKSDMIRGKIK